MIHVRGDWFIDVDQYSYTLEQFAGVSVDKDGVERNVYKNQTYHATLDKALKHFGREVIKLKLAERDMELIEAVAEIKRCNQIIEESVERLLRGEENETD